MGLHVHERLLGLVDLVLYQRFPSNIWNTSIVRLATEDHPYPYRTTAKPRRVVWVPLRPRRPSVPPTKWHARRAMLALQLNIAYGAWALEQTCGHDILECWNHLKSGWWI